MPIATPIYLPPPQPTTGRGPLHSGSTWEGVQRSGRSSFRVKVSIDQVDYHKGTCCGLLTISGLTPQLDNLTTFFEGEIVTGDRFGFKTLRYGASPEDDLKHWNRFHQFRNHKPKLEGEKWNYSSDNQPAIFMRWKEVSHPNIHQSVSRWRAFGPDGPRLTPLPPLGHTICRSS